MLVAVKESVAAVHMGELLPAVGATGIPLTVAETVPAEPVQLLTVAVTEYVPVAAVVAEGIMGFWEVDVKLLGPVQA